MKLSTKEINIVIKVKTLTDAEEYIRYLAHIVRKCLKVCVDAM